MASYPTSVKSFAARSNGQTIDAAHVGDLQDEVNAIEDGLLNATARLNSSHSTVVALSVSGGSTFAGPVMFSSGSTFGGPVVFSSGVTFGANGTISLPRNPVCRVTNSTLQQIPVSYLGLTWDTETVDSTAMHSTASNSSRIFLTSSGIWHIGAQAEWTGNAAASHHLRIVLNDADGIAEQTMDGVNLDPHSQNLSVLHYASDTTAWVSVQARSKDSTGRVNATSTSGGSFFWAFRVSE